MQFSKVQKNNIQLALVVSITTLAFCIFLIDFYFLNQKKKNWVCEICQFDPALGWDNLPNEKKTDGNLTYTSNSLGFRSEEIDQSKEHILIIGDSVAFGHGVNDNETVSHFLQQKISKYQVLNLAVIGYSIDQYYLKLKKEIHRTKPKYIIPIIFSGNDWVETIQNNMWEVAKPFFKLKDDQLILDNPELSIFQCMNYFNRSWFFSKFNHSFLKHRLCRFEKHNEIEGKKVIAMLLGKIKKLGDSVKAKTLFVLSPSLYNFHLNACNKEIASIQFCIENKKKLSFLLKPMNDNSKNNAARFVKSFSGRNYAISQFQNLFKNSDYFYIDHLHYISSKKIDVDKLYNQGDPFHFSPAGNLYLAQSIKNGIKN